MPRLLWVTSARIASSGRGRRAVAGVGRRLLRVPTRARLATIARFDVLLGIVR